MGVTAGGDGCSIPAFGGRIPGVRGGLKTGRDHYRGLGLVTGGLENTASGATPAGWQWGGPGVKGATLESPAQPGGRRKMGAYLINHSDDAAGRKGA